MSGCFALQSAANRVVRTIVTAIHDKILIPRLTAAAAAAVTVRRERGETAFLNIIRPGAFYYSTRDRSGRQEFDPATPENFHRIHRIRGGFAPLFRPPFSLSLSLLSLFFFSRIRPYRRGSNRQNYVVASAKRGISFLAFDGRPSVLCKDRTILFHVLEYTLLFSPHVFFFLSLPSSISLHTSLFLSSSGISPTVSAINFIRATPLLCFALLLAHIFRYPRTQPCSRNPFRSTPAVTLAHLPYTYIANSDIATAVRIYRYVCQLYLRVRHVK